jgi:hypothetical protein
VKKLFILTVFIFTTFFAYSQNNGENEITAENVEIANNVGNIENISNTENDNTVYIIDSFNFEINGITRPFALILAGELFIGEQIIGFSKLEEYIQTKTQLLYNHRVLESVSIEYTINDINEDGKYPVDLLIKIKDTLNIIALPKPNYKSGQGWELTINARDYNFLGTMSPLRVNLGIKEDQHGRTFFNIMADSNTPFRLFDLTWKFKLYNYFEYSPDMPEPIHNKTTTGLSVDLPVKNTMITLEFYEHFIVNEANSDRNMELYPHIGQLMEGLYMSSRPHVSWKIPTGLEIGKYGELTYIPSLSAAFNHELPQWPLDITRKGSSLTFNHSLSFGRIDWQGNFQNGLRVEALNSISYGINSNSTSAHIRLTGTGHHNFDNHFSLSGRLMYRHWINYDFGYESAGDVLRGVWDNDVKADYMVSFNLDLTMGVMKFRPSEWFNVSWFRIFNMDFHLNPFLDAAIYRSSVIEKLYPDAHFTYKNLLTAAGLELIIYPLSFRSLFLRASVGFNMSTLENLRNDPEIHIGMELHY